MLIYNTFNILNKGDIMELCVNDLNEYSLLSAMGLVDLCEEMLILF